jgi:prepilin-type N-terminal cleavage/methylation domain-containing protein
MLVVTRSKRGFTLLEALVALVLAGIVTAGVAMALRTGLDASERLHERTDAHQEARTVLDLLSADLTAAFLSGANPAETLFVGEPTATAGDRPFLSLTTLNYRRAHSETPGEPVSDAVRVDYLLQPAGDASAAPGAPRADADPQSDPGSVLLRRERWLTESGEGQKDVICEHVAGIRVRYSDGADYQNEWKASLDEDPKLTVKEGEDPGPEPVQRQLPRLVEVTLMLAQTPKPGQDRTPRMYRVVVPLGADGVPPFETEIVPQPSPAGAGTPGSGTGAPGGTPGGGTPGGGTGTGTGTRIRR